VYAGWKFNRWETPVSDLASLAMVSLVDDGMLKITVEDLQDPNRRRWQFTFEHAPIYRNILEEYRLELWRRVRTDDNPMGWTVTIPSSPWLSEFRQGEPLIDAHYPELCHYQIGTEDDVIDILSPEPPLIETVVDADRGETKPGKSRVLHTDESNPDTGGIDD
jgi:hypothetical protein